MREASMRNYKAYAQAGKFVNGVAPFGYSLAGRKLERTINIVEGEAEVIRLIFRMFVDENLTTVQIAKRLTEAGILTPGHIRGSKVRKRDATTWSQQAIYNILTNEAYSGVAFAHKYRTISKGRKIIRPREEWIPIPVPAIVDRSVWEQAQTRLNERDFERRSAHTMKHVYLLSRRVKCSCGYHMVGNPVRNKDNTFRKYYKCHATQGALGACGATTFRVDKVDDLVWNFIKELLLNPRALLTAYKEAQQSGNERNIDTKRQIE